MRNERRQPHGMARLRTALALALAALLPAAAPAFAADAAAFDAQAEWATFLDTAGPSVYEQFTDGIAALGDDGDVDAGKCREHWAGIAKAAEEVRVGAFIQHVAYRCAEALGDEDAADAYMERFAALARHALGQASADWAAPPIRIVAGRDIGPILEAAGLEMRYEYLMLRAQPRHMVQMVAARDPGTGRERLFAFDYLDTMVRLQRDAQDAAYPAFRRNYRQSLIARNAEFGVPSARDQRAVEAAFQVKDGPGRVEALRAEAEDGGVQAATMWLETCVDLPFEGCGEGLVDALLTHAEHDEGVFVVLLARLHAEGVGVEKDEDAAMTLLDRAGGLMGDGAATVEYARLHMGLGMRPWPPGLAQRLKRAADGGNDQARMLMALSELHGVEGVGPESARTALAAAAGRGHIGSASILGGRLYRADRFAEALPFLRQAAEGGDAAAQEYLGTALYQGRGVDVDREAGIAWWKRAADGGDSDAMLRLGWEAHAATDTVEALEWYRGAAMAGNPQAALEFAGLVRRGVGETEPDPAKAARVLADIDLPEARRELAMMLVAEDGIDPDPARARKLLEQDAGDDRWSQALLGIGLLDGSLGTPDRDTAMAVLKPGIDALDPVVGNAWATYLYYQSGGAGDRGRAIEHWRRTEAKLSADDGEDGASLRNNFAWALCTGPEFGAAERTEGMQVARRMGDADDLEDLDSGAIDTVAACHAAIGEFPRAIELQRKAVAELLRWSGDDPSLEGMRARLAQYEAGKPFLELEEPAGSTTDGAAPAGTD